MVILGMVVGLSATGIASVEGFMTRYTAHNTVNVLHAIRDAKDGLRNKILNDPRMPEGYNIDTIGNYRPTLDELAPFIRSQATDGPSVDPDKLNAGTGDRKFAIGSLDEDAACYPPLPPDQKQP